MATSIGSQVRGYISSARTAAGKAGDTLGLVTQKLGLESNTYRSSRPSETPAFNYVRPKSPEESSGKSTADPKFLSFPSDLENVNYFITFTFSEKNYHNADFAKAGTDDITYRVRLPMPSSLVDTFKVNYQGTSLGTLIGYGLQSGVLNDVFEILEKNSSNPAEVRRIVEERAKQRAASVRDDFSQPNSPAMSIIRYALSQVSDTAGKALDYVSGTTLNPFQSLFFEGPELRSHNFSFKLSPNSFEESVRLRRIVNIFKTRMLPEKQGLLYKYPDSCLIELSTRQNPFSLYTMYRSVLSGVSVNYAPNNVPVFFKNGFDPVEVALDLNFSEVRPVTREDVEKSLNNKELLL